MSLARRVRKLEGIVVPVRRGKTLPQDPASFARGLLAGEFAAADIDPTHPHHTGWLVRAGAFLATLSPEHQAWLRLERERDPRAYPDALLLPAPEEVILAALDEVMRRG